MDIPITGDIRISSDESSWLVQVRRVAGERSKTPGATVWKSVSYHHSVQLAARAAADRIARTTPGAYMPAEAAKAIAACRALADDAVERYEQMIGDGG